MDMLDAYHCDQEAALDIDDAGPLDDPSEDEGGGDCFARCLAYVLGEEYDPRHWPAVDEEDPASWRRGHEEIVEWLARRDLLILCLRGCVAEDLLGADGLRYIRGGYSRGRGHAVVYDGGTMVYDPDSEGLGLDERIEAYLIIPKNLERTDVERAEPEDDEDEGD